MMTSLSPSILDFDDAIFYNLSFDMKNLYSKRSNDDEDMFEGRSQISLMA